MNGEYRSQSESKKQMIAFVVGLVVIIAFLTTIAYQMLFHNRSKEMQTVTSPVELYVDSTRMINVGTGKFTKDLPCYILRDSVSGVEYLAIPSVGIIKLEKAQ